MPIYEYRCADGHTFDVLQGFNDDPVTVCEVCGKPVERVFHPVAVHFKGSGFYTTDYGKKKNGAKAATEPKEAKESKSDSSSSDSKASDSKPADGKKSGSKSSE